MTYLLVTTAFIHIFVSQAFNLEKTILWYAGHIAIYFKDHGSDGISNLYLSMNPIGDEGVTHIAESLRNNVNIQRLILDSDRIGSNGADSLFSAFEHHPTIKYLSLGRAKGTRDLGEQVNNIGDYAATAISRFIVRAQNLRSLNLSQNGFTPTGCIQIISACLRSSSLLQFSLNTPNMPAAGKLLKTAESHFSNNMDLLTKDSKETGKIPVIIQQCFSKLNLT